MKKPEFDHTHFFSFEKQSKVFDLEKGGFKYWDIIRFDIYLELLWSYRSVASSKKKSVGERLDFLLDCFTFLRQLIFRKVDYIFVTTSRNKTDDGFAYDQNLDDVLRLYGSKSMIFESFEWSRSKRLYNRSFSNPLYLVRRTFLRFFKHESFRKLQGMLIDSFGRSPLSDYTINILISSYKIDRFFYLLILKLKKPKVIFMTQNGIQKGLFSAAKYLNIPVVEFQHGIIDEGHIAYSYNSDIDYRKAELHLPEVFLTFSDFWGKGLFCPVGRIVAVGNSAFSKTVALSTSESSKINPGLLVASSDVFGEDLKDLIKDFVAGNKEVPVYFKLHPNQFGEQERYSKEFESFKSVQVIAHEKSMYDLLLDCNSVLAIQSTALYEGLHLKRKAILYKRKTYTRHKHIFNLPNVFLVDNANELCLAVSAVDNGNVGHNEIFFQDFSLNNFNEAMRTLIHD